MIADEALECRFAGSQGGDQAIARRMPLWFSNVASIDKEMAGAADEQQYLSADVPRFGQS